MTTALALTALVYLWLLIGDFIIALQRWGYEEESIWDRLFWPTRLWWTAMNLLHDWRKELYYRNKYR